MILETLVRHYENLAKQGSVSKLGWCQAKVSYGINLTKDGTVKEILSLKHEEERGKKKVLQPAQKSVPQMVTRSSGVAANYLCDNSKYLLGIDKDGSSGRVQDCFLAAKEKHLKLLQNVDSTMANAVRTYFETWNPSQASENALIREHWDEITDGGNLIFCMNEEEAQDDAAIRAGWDETQTGDDQKTDGICMVTGKPAEISRIHRTIKGVPGAQSSGAALVSFNAPAFESYGKEQSYNAPVGRYAEFAYTTALNYLLDQNKYRLQLGDTMIVYWAESGQEACQKAFSFVITPNHDNQREIQKVFDGLQKQKYIDLDDIEIDPEQKFYILGIAPNAARLSVRFFYEDSFGNILENIAAHYRNMDIVKPKWEEREYLGVREMLDETANQKSKDKKPVPNMAAMVMQAVISGDWYPASLFTDLLIRIRAEQGTVTWGRAAMIKAYLIRNCNWEKGEDYMGLNKESRDKAYVLGRLFAVLESIQKDANPEIKATIRDRYFNSACATPAVVFPVLIKLKNSHIKKLEREKTKLKDDYEELLAEIMDKLEEETSFPLRLTLEEQGKFDLGYYHQMQEKYKKREDK